MGRQSLDPELLRALGPAQSPRWRRCLNRILGGLALGIVAAGTLLAWKGAGPPDVPQYKTQEAQRGNLTVTVTATGTLNAVITVEVGSQVSGTIKELLADFNSPVKKGQLIARIDPDLFETKRAQARADLQAAQAAVLNAQASVARAEADVSSARANEVRGEVQVRDARTKYNIRATLFREGGISQEERDTAQATYDAAVASSDVAGASRRSAQAQLEAAQAQLEATRAQVAQKQAALAQAQVDVDHTFIRAPVDGTVVSRSVDVGQTVAASLQAPVLFTLAEDLAKMELHVNVDEADVGRVREGQSATFTVDAYPNRTYRARITQVRYVSKTVSGVVTYETVLSLDNTDLSLRPGMTATAVITVQEVENCVVAPNTALRFVPPATQASASSGRGGLLGKILPGPPPMPAKAPADATGEARRPRVWTLRDGQLVAIPVTVGATDGIRTEITAGGIEPGTALVVDAIGASQ
jgi:HlyD family secretion protein